MTPSCYELADLFESNGRFTDHSSSDGYLRHQVHFRIDGRVVYQALHGTPEKKNPEEISHWIWKAKRRDYHAESTCLEITGPNSHVHTFHNDMVPSPVETTCDAEQVRGHRFNEGGARSYIVLVISLWLELQRSLVRMSVYRSGAWGLDVARSARINWTTMFSCYKFRSASANGARSASAPRARNKLKSALELN
ncbi:hypothetical protein TNCV_4238541 [Trichonephila clavipes]|nr:hypothetical protein TNCV_4238541 [Trichonephila clavipes]